MVKNRHISIPELLNHSFVISINPDRYDIFRKVFKYSGLSIIPKLYEGISVTTFENVKYDKRFLWNSFHRKLNCTYTHISIVKLAQYLNWPFVCIFEDDAWPCKNVLEELEKYLSNIPGIINLLTLGRIKFRIRPQNQPIIIDNTKYLSFNVNHGSHAYIVFKEGYSDYLYAAYHYNAFADCIFPNVKYSYATEQNMFIQYNIDRKNIHANMGLGYMCHDMNRKTIIELFPSLDDVNNQIID